ncbi:unnamed protein product [Urochloa decumbens]|uniref:No apical meristem-associated C-terminal domain-containing protein n=1 Tax=Urochloa decumbens TaxID=240449 RepID=A0ABC9E1X5_9POAL
MDSYTDLLNRNEVGSSNVLDWDDTQYASPPEEQMFGQPVAAEVEEQVFAQPPAAEVEGVVAVKGNKKRSKNFSVKEDNLLVAAWLEIGMDAVQGTDQPRATFWERIQEHYHSHKDFDTDRNWNSLAHRWGIIQDAVNKFCSWYAHVQRRPESGVTEQDKVLKACELFKKEEGCKFGMLHCWNVLQHEQKWHDTCANKKQKTAANASPGTSTPPSNANGQGADEAGGSQGAGDAINGRPDGRKKEKERQRKGKNPSSPAENLYMDALDNLWAKKKEVEELKEMKKKERNDERISVEMKRLEIKMAAEKERSELQREDLELRRRIEDDKVMNMDLGGMGTRQRYYYERLQDEIIARRFGGAQHEA